MIIQFNNLCSYLLLITFLFINKTLNLFINKTLKLIIIILGNLVLKVSIKWYLLELQFITLLTYKFKLL